MAASATFALNAGLCVRRARLAIVAPDLRHSRRLQAETPLIDLSEFGQPPLPSAGITRRPWYYGPIRHLPRPALALTGSPLTIRLPTVVAETDFPCCVSTLCHTCCHLYPGETVRGVSRSLA